MTIGFFSIVVVWHVLPLLICAPLRRYDDTFHINVYVKISEYISRIHAYISRIGRGEAKLSSYRRNKKSKHQAGGFSDDDDFDGRD